MSPLVDLYEIKIYFLLFIIYNLQFYGMFYFFNTDAIVVSRKDDIIN